MLLPHALKALESPAPLPAWVESAFKGRLAYLKCMQDRALPPVVQDVFVKQSGTEWKSRLAIVPTVAWRRTWQRFYRRFSKTHNLEKIELSPRE